MPRKKQLGPATPKQVLEFFDQAHIEVVEAFFSLATDIVKQRRAEEAGSKPEVPAIGTKGTKAKRRSKKSAAAQETGEGESLQDA